MAGSGEDWLAALVGSLQGGVEGLQFMQRAKQDKKDRETLAERQRMQDALAAEDREERRLDREQQRRDRSRTSVSSMLEEIGRGGRIAPEQAAGAREAGLGHRLEETPDFQHSYFAQAGPVPMMVPDVATTVAPTAAERLADQERAKEQARRAQVAAGIADPYERQAFEANPSGYKPTRESFMPLPIRQREAADAADAQIGAEVRKGEALLPIKLREKEEGAKIEAKYRPSAKERGPTDYQTFGMIDKLNGRFNTNTKATREIARQHQVMLASWHALEKGTAGKGLAEQGIVSTFNKILDPDSVVREGEYDRTAQGQALLQRMQTVKDNLQSGGKISRAVLKDMVDLAGTYAQRAESFTKAEQQRVGAVADRMGIDKTLIFTAEPSTDDGPPPSPPSARVGSGPTVGTIRTINGQRARWDGKGWLPVQ